MNDLKINKDGSPTMRTLAHLNNPFIGSVMIGDTLNNVAGGLAIYRIFRSVRMKEMQSALQVVLAITASWKP
jgi:hypothetical protein